MQPTKLTAIAGKVCVAAHATIVMWYIPHFKLHVQGRLLGTARQSTLQIVDGIYGYGGEGSSDAGTFGGRRL
jgi:hypothetical protein